MKLHKQIVLLPEIIRKLYTHVTLPPPFPPCLLNTKKLGDKDTTDIMKCKGVLWR